MWKRVKRGLLFVACLYLGVLLMLVALETHLMYPAPGVGDADWNPDWLQHEDVFVTTDAGNKIHGWYCPHFEPKHVILLCHGNGEHVAYMADEIEYIRERYDSSVFAFDYRGYGKSEGKPFEAGILTDGQAALQWLAEREGVEPSEIVVWGRSLGGAVAVHVASYNEVVSNGQRGAKAIILDRTFSSMVDVAAHHYPFLPVRLLLSNRYPSHERIRRYTGPILQFHGKPDEVVPFEFGRKLFESAVSQDKHFVSSDNMSHNSPWPEEFYDRVEEFLESLDAD